MSGYPLKAEPGVLDTACRRIREELGCSDERAFDLLYGWVESSQNAPCHGLAQVVVARGSKRYLFKTTKKC